MKLQLSVPIYKARVLVVVARDLVKARSQEDKLFGSCAGLTRDAAALHSYDNRGLFGLFYARDALSIGVLAHEVFHCTHRILEWTSGNFDAEHHEPAAYLNEWLMERVYPLVRRYM